jgi:hypothetical protein
MQAVHYSILSNNHFDFGPFICFGAMHIVHPSQAQLKKQSRLRARQPTKQRSFTMRSQSKLFAAAAAAMIALTSQAFAGDLLEADLARPQASTSVSREAVRAELKEAQAQGTVQAGDVVQAPDVQSESLRSAQEVRAEGRTALRAQRNGAVDTTLIR